MSKHTQGPWKVDKFLTIRAADGIGVTDILRDPAQRKANALTMAAAPELLSALKKTISLLQAAQRKELLDEALCAIAKAQGVAQ